jgi:hypothetical protein
MTDLLVNRESSPVRAAPLPVTTHGRAGMVGELVPAVNSRVNMTNFKEFDLQCAVATYLDFHSTNGKKFVWFHCPSEGARKVQYRVKLKLQGLKRGVADCVLFCAGGRTLSIELKLAAALSPGQKEWQEQLSRLGHVTYLVRAKTPAEAVEQVDQILRKERLM